MVSFKKILPGLSVGLLVCLPDGLADAQTSNSVVTFNVDMSAQVAAGIFVSGAEVDVRGTFNGWAPPD